MGGVVVFVPDDFRAAYPQFTPEVATDAQLSMWFTKATFLLNNTKCSHVKDLEQRKMLLWMLVAHMATLQGNIDEGNTGVGRVSSATEGTVSVALDYGTMGNSERWYLQTPYGAEYWQFTKKFRTINYRLGLQPMPVRRNRF